jgi:hypothetical protein
LDPIPKVDVDRAGEYTLTYKAKDASNNWSDGSNNLSNGCKGAKTYTRTVTVIDTLKPVIAIATPGKHTIFQVGGVEGTAIDTSSSDAHAGKTNPAASHDFTLSFPTASEKERLLAAAQTKYLAAKAAGKAAV